MEAITKLEMLSSYGKIEIEMVNYMVKFAPSLAKVIVPLRSLLQKDVEFMLSKPQMKAFNEVKEIITNSPVLGYLDYEIKFVLECDASQNGPGCCLMQENRLIAFAPKSLTKTEQTYTNIEKELLAIVFGCERFHCFTYGRDKVVHSEHKLIMRKSLPAAPPRECCFNSRNIG